jgi:hypothetical protein
MRRRDFIGAIYGTALAWPRAADAQQPANSESFALGPLLRGGGEMIYPAG